MRSPEILAPVGDWNMLRAAVHNGADAVYLGMPGFNARGRAATIELDELKAMLQYAHLYGVRVLLAFNVLIFDREMPDAIDLLEAVLPLGPDALIVQDIGLVRIIRAMAPEQVVHASTQMTITCVEAIRATEDLKLVRYVLARELSIDQIAAIRSETEKELEVFVHGALCVSYSGQCLTSESMGGRSANRGQCAQSCRLEYDLVVDGERRALGAGRYLVSPQDLCSIEDVPRLLDAGIDSFKIEGRLKSASYVASAARSYKELSLTPDGDRARRESTRMRRTYSRGHFNGWMNGVDHQKLVDPLINSHYGIEVGRVESVDASTVTVDSSEPFGAGDGLVFLDGKSGYSIGGSLYSCKPRLNGLWTLAFSNDFELHRISTSMRVFINASPRVEADLGRSFNDRAAFKRIPIQLTLSGSYGAPIRATATDDAGNTVTSVTSALLEPATSAPVSYESMREELSALGGTVYRLDEMVVKLPDSFFIHKRELKALRRAVTDALNDLRMRRQPIALHTAEARALASSPLTPVPLAPSPLTGAPASGVARLNVLVRDRSQIEGLAGLAVDTVYLDFEFGKEYAAAAQEVRALGFKVAIATTRIMKPGERAHVKVIERIAPDEVLVRNLGALHYLAPSGLRMVGDFSLNASNRLTAEWLFEKGIARLCPSYDLNGEQLLELIGTSDASRFEITVHQYIPAFHMEHCVFAAFLSTGSSYRDCGRPCEKHRVELRDSKGALHPLKADSECRNTMFNGTPQSAVKLIPDLVSLGVSAFRVEGLFESASELRSKVEAYRELIDRRSSAAALLRRLGVVERYGVTDGQLYAIGAYRDRKKTFTPLTELRESSDPGLRSVLPPALP